MIALGGTFTAYAVGLCYASACTSLTDDEATAQMNTEHPTGIDSAWEIANEPFASGDPNGRPCDQHADTHRHILFTC
jgi:hypothetical protein